MVYREHIHIDPAYRAALRDRGLARVADVLSRVDGRVAAWSRSTDTVYVPGRTDEPGYYLKRYYYPTWRKRIRGMLRGTFFGLHRAQAEYRALRSMRALGISAARPVAFGVRRVAHFVAACFLITEEVLEAHNLTTFAREVATGRRPLSAARRRRMIDTLARQAAQMHAAGFSHGQLFWRNILVRDGPDGAPEFFFLDAQPLPRWRRLSPGDDWWQRELAHLTVSALPFTTRIERLRFLSRYFEVRGWSPPVKQHARAIGALADRWRRHETQRIKMNDLFEAWNRQLEREGELPAHPVTSAPPSPASAGGAQP